jgi:phage FluMu protein Com
MAISFICSNIECGKALSAPDTAAGKKVRCPKCGTVTAIPAPAAAPSASPFAIAGQPPPSAKKTRPAKAKKSKPRSAASGVGSELAGTIVKVVCGLVALAVVGGAIYGIMMVAKGGGQVVEAESKGVFGAKHTAEHIALQNNLVLVRDAIRQWQAETGEYPLTLQDLVDKRLVSSGALRPSKEAPEYQYIAHQREDMSENNVLVYEEKPTDGLCNVLLHDGQVVTMSPERLQLAIEQTQKNMQAK